MDYPKRFYPIKELCKFMSEMFKNICKLLKIEKIRTNVYHLKSNETLERSHRTLAEYMRHFVNKSQTD